MKYGPGPNGQATARELQAAELIYRASARYLGGYRTFQVQVLVNGL